MHVQDAITLEYIKLGNEMVNLKGSEGWESQFGRYYKKSTYNEIKNIPDMLKSYLKVKKNPSSRSLSPKRIRTYRAGDRKKTRRYRKK